MTTASPSAVRRTSSSIRSAPARTAASNAANVFSGAAEESPRCAIVRMRPGSGRRPGGIPWLGVVSWATAGLEGALNVLLVRGRDLGGGGGERGGRVIVLQQDPLERGGQVLVAGRDEGARPVLHARGGELVDRGTELRLIGVDRGHRVAGGRRRADRHVPGVRREVGGLLGLGDELEEHRGGELLLGR